MRVITRWYRAYKTAKAIREYREALAQFRRYLSLLGVNTNHLTDDQVAERVVAIARSMSKFGSYISQLNVALGALGTAWGSAADSTEKLSASLKDKK